MKILIKNNKIVKNVILKKLIFNVKLKMRSSFKEK